MKSVKASIIFNRGLTLRATPHLQTAWVDDGLQGGCGSNALRGSEMSLAGCQSQPGKRGLTLSLTTGSAGRRSAWRTSDVVSQGFSSGPVSLEQMKPFGSVLRGSSSASQGTSFSKGHHDDQLKPSGSVLGSENGPSMIGRTLNRVLRKGSRVPLHRLKLAGYVLADRCTNGVAFEEFFSEFRDNLPDTFYSWWLVTELHAWMLSARLLVGSTCEGHLTRNFMTEALWKDCDLKAKLVIGPGKMSASDRQNYIWDIAEEYQAALIIYDLGILGDDKELANSLWRRFFLLADRPDPTKIELLVRYVRQTMAALDRVSLDTLLTVDETFAYNLWQPLLPDDLNQGPTLSKIS